MPRSQASPFQLPKRRELAAHSRTQILLNHQLLQLGEELEIQIRCVQSNQPPDRLTVFNHYLKKVDKSQTEIALSWQKTEDGWETKTRITPDATGSYLIRISNGTRDRINPYFRYVAVIDNRSVVCNLRHLLDTQMANYHSTYHRNYLPADYELIFNQDFGKIEANPNWIGHQVYRYYQAKFGAQVVPFVNLCHLPFAKNSIELNPDDLTVEEAAQRIKTVQDTWQNDFQYLRPEIMGFESLNQNIAMAARECGIQGISGLRPDWFQQTADQYLNLQGMPLFPYFINEKDLRAAAPQRSSMVGFMTTAHPLLSRDYAGYRLCPAEALQSRAASLENMQPLLDSLEEFIRNRDQHSPLFLNLELKGHPIPDATRMNLMMIRYLLKSARRERVVFASRQEIARYFLRHFDRTPERTIHLTDTYRNTPTSFYLNPAGRHKAPYEHDAIYLENNKHRICFRKPEMLPYYFYDYSRFTGNSLAEVPPSVDVTGIRITVENQFDPGHRINLFIETPEKMTHFPLAFWELPFALGEVKHSLQHNFKRFMPVNEPESKVLNAIAFVDLETGINNFYLDFGVKVKGN